MLIVPALPPVKPPRADEREGRRRELRVHAPATVGAGAGFHAPPGDAEEEAAPREGGGLLGELYA